MTRTMDAVGTMPGTMGAVTQRAFLVARVLVPVGAAE